MTVTALDPKSALVVIDLQKGTLALETVHPVGEILERAATLAAEFRRRGLPVVLVNVTGFAPGRTAAGPPRPAGWTPPPDWADLADELDVQPSDLLVTKKTWGAFHGTTLHEQLQQLGVTQVVLVGISTSAGVESTARAAYEHGYNVTLATDAMTDRVAEAHDNSVEQIVPRLGETGTTDEILALLAQTG
jgi:nicotinamidase-related amidase